MTESWVFDKKGYFVYNNVLKFRARMPYPSYRINLGRYYDIFFKPKNKWILIQTIYNFRWFPQAGTESFEKVAEIAIDSMEFNLKYTKRNKI